MSASFAAFAVCSAAAPVGNVHRVCGTPHDNQTVVHDMRAFNRSGIFKKIAVSRADETRYPVNLNFKLQNREKMAGVMAWRESEDGKIQVYGNEYDSDFNMTMSLPTGTFQVLAYGYCEDGDGLFLLYKDNYTFGEGDILTLDTSEATNRTDIETIGPDGESLCIGEGGNCEKGNALNMMFYEREPLFSANVVLFSDGQKYVLSNNLSSSLNLVRYQLMVSGSKGVMSMAIPVDLNKSRVGSTATGWQQTNVNFSHTPLNDKIDNMLQELEGSPHNYGFIQNILVNTDDMSLCGILGLSIYGEGAQTATGRISMWSPTDYVPPVTTMLAPSGDVLFGPDSWVQSMPIRMGTDGLVQSGVNMAFEGYMTSDSTNIYYNDGNPVFSPLIPEEIMLANCAPSLITAPSVTGRFQYSFTGRYGENMNIDACDISDGMNPEILEQLGGNPNSVLVTANGETVCDNLRDLNSGDPWDKDATYTAVIKTDNILIDKEIAGQTSGTIRYNPVKNFSLPTVTALQLRDSGGKISDRLKSGADGILSLYASALTLNANEKLRYGFYDYNPVSNIKVEYSPYSLSHTYDVWEDISMTAHPSADYTPGWGNCYEGTLENIDKPAPYGWFALRITLETADGASQQQTISPAFCISSLSTIESIADNRDEADDTRTEYFTLQGIRITNPIAGQIYIKRQGSKVQKFIMR